jgi:glycine cleavage system H protein
MSEVKENLLYTNDHEWVRIEGNEATVGITDYAQSELGEIVFVDVPIIGESIQQFDIFGSIEAVKTVADLNMPMSGTVKEFNNRLDSEPELANNDPYGDGWIIKISLDDPREVANLLTSEQYKEIC